MQQFHMDDMRQEAKNKKKRNEEARAKKLAQEEKKANKKS